jgi:hypothetical protein
MNRLLAAAFTLLQVFSPLQLENLLRLRDYSKAPFSQVHVLVWRTYGASFALPRSACFIYCGGACGGCWLRISDRHHYCDPAFCVTMMLFLPRLIHPGLHWHLASIMLFLAAFVICSYPFQLKSEARSKFHVLLLGCADIYEDRMGVGGAPYNEVHRYFDVEPLLLMQGYSKYVYGEHRLYEEGDPAYEAMGQRYVNTLVKIFPADFYPTGIQDGFSHSGIRYTKRSGKRCSPLHG